MALCDTLGEMTDLSTIKNIQKCSQNSCLQSYITHVGVYRRLDSITFFIFHINVLLKRGIYGPPVT